MVVPNRVKVTTGSLDGSCLSAVEDVLVCS